ncbi:hypothetical protein K1719_018966 [Acacia pycnantha]|nr:hypothetical protein K1719_018966 [Acacia pycnantha]
MAFTGTLDKCNACDKTVYVVDLLSLEGLPYHKTCFKCSHCRGFLAMSTYSSMDGVLYCKPHFEQLFKESGNFSKNFHTVKSSEKSHDTSKNTNKFSSWFSGTQDKCAVCTKTVYPLEKVSLEGESYHKTCFRCVHAGCPLTHSSYAALDGVLYCRHHFAQLFMEKGDYNHVKEVTANKKNSASHDQPPDEHPSQDQDDTEHHDKEEVEDE